MTALTPLQKLWLTETVRLREEHAGPLEDLEANRLARTAGGDVHRIVGDGHRGTP
ncbi:hypothetical protein L9Z73_27450 [Pseudomonas sp. TNT11]|uniref:Uncharacterized protein n=1 Tax=Pseudomonas emilianonis TaxID=2915812 RepID=A0ABT0EQA8_9PSED|nr:hypothetical protein [Pseudomonas emilianonis]MCK1787924.1 hypothetical protein [Pseudomonas emilianonis]